MPSTLPAFGDWIATLAGRPRWHCFLALDRRSAVACGALFVGMSGRTWLGFAATLESFRGHGAQSALLSARLERAAALGSPETYAETSADDGSGDRNPSLQNLERAGFTRFYRREMYLATS